MKQEEFDRWLIDAAKDYNAPPDENLSDLWTSIDAQRIDAQRVATNTPLRIEARRNTSWHQQPRIRMAAVLLVGVALGRVSSTVNQPSNSASMNIALTNTCLLYTSPSPRDRQKSRMPSSA